MKQKNQEIDTTRHYKYTKYVEIVISTRAFLTTYPGTDTSAASGDFEISIEILDGTSCKESLHHQQNAVYKECSCYTIYHILEDVNPV